MEQMIDEELSRRFNNVGEEALLRVTEGRLDYPQAMEALAALRSLWMPEGEKKDLDAV